MTYITDLINPPPTEGLDQNLYKYLNSVLDVMNSLAAFSNPSVLLHADFNELSAKGLNPTVPADGNNTEFIKDWFIVGAAAANYTITPTQYPNESTVRSASDYYVHNVVTSHNGGAFYFYQRQADTLRKYQNNNLTYTLVINNNQNKVVKVRTDILFFFDPSQTLKKGRPIYIQQGMNLVTSTIETDSLANAPNAIGNGSYAEFRLVFDDLFDGTANLDIYQIKCEFGTVGTPLQLHE